MAEHLLDLLRNLLVQYGYGAVALTLLLENAGLPLPGETILLMASFLAYSEHRLQLPYVIIVATCAATLGDNIGFAIGAYGGRPLLRKYRQLLHIRNETIDRGEQLFQRYGAATIFFARFIAGLRVVAGPLAGVLRMNWRKFAIFNFLGAVVWVTVISTVGYLFGKHWEKLMAFIQDANLAIAAAVLLIVGVWIWRSRRGIRRGSH